MGDVTRLLLTGATGFVGRAVLSQARAQGLEVVAVTRGTPPAAWTEAGVIPCCADLADPAAIPVLRAALRGVEQEEDAASALAPLLALPLLRDALGRPRSPASFPLGEGDERVSFADTPYEAELEPWLGHVLWVPPGDPARALLGATVRA